jgi:hypothetical protein
MKVLDNKVLIRFRFEGDTTYCEICDAEDKKVILDGFSRKDSRDTFVKFYGRKYALTNAISGLDKEARKNIWKDYLSQVRLPKAQARKNRQLVKTA